jgi:hypothetical protein
MCQPLRRLFPSSTVSFCRVHVSPSVTHRRHLSLPAESSCAQVPKEPLHEGHLIGLLAPRPVHRSTATPLPHRRQATALGAPPRRRRSDSVPWSQCNPNTSPLMQNPTGTPLDLPAGRRCRVTLRHPWASPLPAVVTFRCELVPETLSGQVTVTRRSSPWGHSPGWATPGLLPAAPWSCTMCTPPEPNVSVHAPV